MVYNSTLPQHYMQITIFPIVISYNNFFVFSFVCEFFSFIYCYYWMPVIINVSTFLSNGKQKSLATELIIWEDAAHRSANNLNSVQMGSPARIGPPLYSIKAPELCIKASISLFVHVLTSSLRLCGLLYLLGLSCLVQPGVTHGAAGSHRGCGHTCRRTAQVGNIEALCNMRPDLCCGS